MKVFRKTLLLFGVLIILSAYYFYEIKTTPIKEKKKQENKKLFVIEKEKVNSIYIKNRDKEIEIMNGGKNWIIKGKNYECDKNEIESLINKILAIEIEKTIEVNDLSLYGLDKSDKIIELEGDGEKYTLYIGDEAPTGSYVYTTKDKKNINLVYKWDIENILKKEIFDFRDKRIIPVDIVKTDIEEFEIKRAKYNYYFVKNGDYWYIKDGINDLASKEKLDEIFENIFDRKIKEYTEDKSEIECGLEKPHSTFRIKIKNNEYFLYLGKKKGNLYYAKNSLKPYIFLVEDKILEDIPEEINKLRERKLFDFNVFGVNEITIIKGNEELKFLKEKDTWYLEKDKTKKISKKKIEDFLSDLRHIEIENFIDYSENKLKDYSLFPPEIKISAIDETKKIEIHFGKKTDKEIYGYHPRRKILFTIPSSDYEKINKEKGFFIEK
jgi:hypothetical protein